MQGKLVAMALAVMMAGCVDGGGESAAIDASGDPAPEAPGTDDERDETSMNPGPEPEILPVEPSIYIWQRTKITNTIVVFEGQPEEDRTVFLDASFSVNLNDNHTVSWLVSHYINDATTQPIESLAGPKPKFVAPTTGGVYAVEVRITGEGEPVARDMVYLVANFQGFRSTGLGGPSPRECSADWPGCLGAFINGYSGAKLSVEARAQTGGWAGERSTQLCGPPRLEIGTADGEVYVAKDADPGAVRVIWALPWDAIGWAGYFWELSAEVENVEGAPAVAFLENRLPTCHLEISWMLEYSIPNR